MYLRKTTTTRNRGTDVLEPLYAQLNKTHTNAKPLDVLQIGAGVGIKALANMTKTSRFARRVDGVLRSLPLPIRYFESYEPMELYHDFSEHGYQIKLIVADINPNVLAVVKQQRTSEEMAFELTDICNISDGFLLESFDVCIILNVFPHVHRIEQRQQAITNLTALTKNGGYILGAPMFEQRDGGHVVSDQRSKTAGAMEEVGKLLYRKTSD